MTMASAIAPRDFPLRTLDEALLSLAVGAELPAALPAAPWLREVGVAISCGPDRLAGHPDWLSVALPSATLDDLVLRTLLRDPLYRLHVDSMVAAVCADIGASGRWARLEELLNGPLRVLSPRIASLMGRGSSASVAPEREWAQFDERCWGVAGAAETLFPILVARLPAFVDTPVFVSGLDDATAELTAAAVAGEGVVVGADRLNGLDTAASRGLPVWRRDLADGRTEATLALPVRCLATAPTMAWRRPFSLGVPRCARTGSQLLATPPTSDQHDLWDAADGVGSAVAFTGVLASERWPEAGGAAPRGLPSREDMIGLVRTRQPSADPSDAALLTLARHPLYGLWLQILLLEALDRELGDATLVFAPPADPMLTDVEGSTRVLYRPRPGSPGGARTTLDLGLVDVVLGRLADALDVRAVGALGRAAGPWSLGLRLLSEVGIVEGTRDQWTLTPFVLDRLHGGGLMTSIIRRGKALRERVHFVLTGLWTERNSAEEPLHV